MTLVLVVRQVVACNPGADRLPLPPLPPAQEQPESGELPTVSVQTYQRGDINHDGAVDVSDVVKTLVYLFLSGEAPSCLRATDGNADGSVDGADGGAGGNGARGAAAVVDSGD